MFDRFTSRIAIRGAIRAETGLHIGVGGSSLDPSATDSPVIRDAAGRPFIPGSSFKGALRAHLESLIRGLGRKKPRTCDPLADPCITPEGMKKIKDEAEQQAGGDRANYDALLTEKILDQSCEVCRLFGSPWLASCVIIKDLFVDPDGWAGRIELRDGVGIDRDTGTARQGVKYDFEVVPVTTRFRFEAVAENAEVLIGLLLIGLRQLEQGRVALGGKTTRGLGGVSLALEEIEAVGDGDSIQLEGGGSGDLVDYLITGRGRTLRGATLQSYLDRKISAFCDAWLADKE